jgi:large repetitive protein
VAASSTSCTFATDQNGSYTVSVAARTEAGTSTNPAATTVPVSVAVAPDAPAGVTGRAAANAITVSWTAPATPGAVVTGYLVTASASGYPSRTCTPPVTRSPCTITGLSGGVGYAVQVVATGKAGNSPAAAAPNSVVPTGALGAPTGVPAGAASAGSRTVLAGAKVSISATGFKPNTAVQLRLYPAGTSMGAGTATAAGNFSATVTIPKGTAGGTYTLLAWGLNGGNQARFVREGVVVPGTKGAAVKGAGSHQTVTGNTTHTVSSSTGGGTSGAGTSAAGTNNGSAGDATAVMAVTGPAGGPVLLAGFAFVVTGLVLTLSVRRRRARQ